MEIIKKNCLQLKAAHIPGRINVVRDGLNRLEMSGDYHLKIDLFASKLNRLLKTYVSVIPRKAPDNIKNALRLNWSKIKNPPLLHLPILLF
jgi:hypothetical protein